LDYLQTARMLFLGCFLHALAVPAWPRDTDYALIMPGAASSLLLDITLAGERLVAVGERGHILISEDAGASWKQARVPTSVMLNRGFFVDNQLGWGVGHDGNIPTTLDAGKHWALQRDGVSDQARINEEHLARARSQVASLREALRAGQAGDDAKVQDLAAAEHELDKARELMAQPPYPPPLMDIWFANPDRGWAAGAFGTLLHTSNGGARWENWGYKVDNPEELHFNGVAGDSTGTLYLASEWGYVFRSSSSGETWEAIETGYEGSFFGVLVNPASDHVFAYGLRGTIYRSSDHGENWEQLDSHSNSSLFGATATEQGVIVFVGSDAAVVTSADDGDTFIPLPQAIRHGLYGVAHLNGAKFVATGDGGSIVLSIVPSIGGADRR